MTHNIHEQEPDEICFAGDWHGFTDQAQKVMIAAHERGVRHIIQVGDFGFWRSSERFLRRIQKLAQKYDQYVYFVDGNHEDFPYLYTFPVTEHGTREILPRIHHLPRGFHWEWNGIDYMAMGGAYSVDKKWRTPGYDWFRQEEITDEDVLVVANDLHDVDVLVTHDSPLGAPNPVTDDPERQAHGIRMFGQDAIYEAEQHRLQLKKVTDLADPVLIVHGHYHAAGQGRYRQKRTGTLTDVVSLDEGAAKLTEHTLFITLADLHVIKDDNRVS